MGVGLLSTPYILISGVIMESTVTAPLTVKPKLPFPSVFISTVALAGGGVPPNRSFQALQLSYGIK